MNSPGLKKGGYGKVNYVESFVQLIAKGASVAELKAAAQNRPEFKAVYPNSVHQYEQSVLFMVKGESGKKLIIANDGSPLFVEFSGKLLDSASGLKVKEADLNVENSLVLRKYFPFTNPVSLASAPATFGVGDRLGVASGGHIRVLRNSKAKPILAQQSIRELNLTGRTYPEVLADAVWAVFQEDYQDGFGADGDHLKTPAEVKMALDYGFTMITLDCSEHINNVSADDTDKINALYNEIAPEQRAKLEQTFLNKEFKLKSGLTISFSPEKLKLNIVIYQKAINFAIQIYNDLIRTNPKPVDFEVSIDETLTPTDPASHYFVASQLMEAGVKVNSMAPRFCGEFQKGIDYIGNLAQFEKEYKEHQQIADHFGYKLSIHSGSDKFSVFPIIGRECKGHIHVKTAGTNWLEAVRVIIEADPALYWEMHKFALENLAEAKKYYHISADMNRVPNIETLSDTELKDLMNQNDARQLIHITYGLILQAKDAAGNSRFRDRIYACLHQHEDLYYEMLQKHIGKHLELLNLT